MGQAKFTHAREIARRRDAKGALSVGLLVEGPYIYVTSGHSTLACQLQ